MKQRVILSTLRRTGACEENLQWDEYCKKNEKTTKDWSLKLRQVTEKVRWCRGLANGRRIK